MRVLAIDTSTAVSSVAIAEPDKLIAEYTLDARNTHSERLMVHIARMMEESDTQFADIAALAVTVGPGSFTGLRIGLTTAKALAYAWNVPVVGVPTLESLASQLPDSERLVCAILDAQQHKVYVGLFANGVQQWPFQVMDLPTLFTQLMGLGSPVVFTGEASDLYAQEILACPGFTLATPDRRLARAATVALLGIDRVMHKQTQSALEVMPLYIRRAAAEVLWEKRHGKQQPGNHD